MKVGSLKLKAEAEIRCRDCGESWNTINGLYCCKLCRYVTGADDSQLRYMGCPMLSD